MKISRIKIENYYLPIAIGIAVILIVPTSIFVFFSKTNDINKGYELAVGAIITLVTTFAGISIPLSILAANRKQDEILKEEGAKRKNRRIMGFMLGLIWNELRINNIYLKDVKRMFDFARFSQARLDVLLGGLWKLITSLNNLTDHVKDNSFIASQNSGAVITYDDDDLFSAVQQAYEDIGYFKFQMKTVLEDLSIKQYAEDKGLLANLSAENKQKYKETFLRNSKKADEELAKAIKNIDKAIDLLDKKLNTLGIKRVI